jgi:4-hydroxy-tetrahydrodipicolinate synthase
MFLHYQALSEASDLPVLAYTVPGRTGINISPSLWSRIASLPGICGLKDASGDISRSASYLSASPKPIYSGNDDAILPLLSLGGKGCISVLSNLVPAQVQTLCDSFQSGDVAKAAKIQLSLLPLIKALFSQTNPIPIKWALARLGFCKEQWRLPLTEPSDETKQLLETEMEHAGLI